MQQTGLLSEHVMAAEWEKTMIQELDITGTDLSTECLISVLTRTPALRFLSAGHQDGLTDHVLKAYFEQGNPKNLIAIDLNGCDNLSDEILYKLLRMYGGQLRGLCLSGIPHLTEQFWLSMLPILKNVSILVMGMPEGCCQKIHQKIHVDGLIDGIANNCPLLERLEIRWDPSTLRFSDKSQKAIDIVRVKCPKLRCLVLSDGKYFEQVKANFERADRTTVVRTTTNCCVSLCYLLSFYNDLLFN